MLSLIREKRSMSTTSTACWTSRVTSSPACSIFSVKAEAVGQAGQAVAKHFGPKRALGLRFNGPIDEAQQATAARALFPWKGRELQPEISRGDAIAVAEIKLIGSCGTGEDIPAAGRAIGPIFEAVGIVPVERRAGRKLDRVLETVVIGQDGRTVLRIADDGRGNGECAEQGRIVRCGNVRSSAGFVPLPSRTTRPASG